MTVSYITSGTAVYSTGSPSPATPAHNVKDLLILAVGTKPDTTPATAPSGWTLLGAASGGAGTTGIDTGPMRIGIFYRIADGSGLDTTGAITITGNNVSAAQVHVFRLGSTSNDWDIAGVGAADTTTGTAFSVPMPSDPGLTVGDMLFAQGVIPTDVGASAQFTAEQVSAAGITTVSLTEIGEWQTSLGQDMGGWSARGPVVTGTSTGVPTVSATASGTTTNVAGPAFLVRMREVAGATQITGSESTAITATETSSVSVSLAPTGGTGNITFVGASNLVYGSRTNSTANKPAGVVDGDFLIAHVIAGATTSATVPTAPAGWTPFGTPSSVSDVSSFNVKGNLYYKFASGEGASWTWTNPAESTGIQVLAYRGVDPATPLDATPTTNANSSGGATATWTALTTVTDNAMLVALDHDWATNANNLSPPTGYTERVEGTILYGADKVQATAGTTGSPSHTVNNVAGNPWSTYLIALRPNTGALDDEVALSAAETSSAISVGPDVVDMGQVASGSSKTAGTTIPIIATKDIPAGTLLVMGVICDNSTSTTAPVITFPDDASGGTWTNMGGVQQSTVTTTAGSGIWGWAYYVYTVNSISATDLIVTVTLDQSVVAKAVTIDGYQNMPAGSLAPYSVTVNGGTGGPPSITSAASAHFGDIAVGIGGNEADTIPGQDTSTTRGVWDAPSGIATSGAATATNVGVSIQDKIVADVGTVNFNAAGTNDGFSVLALFAGKVAPVSYKTASDSCAVTITDSSSVSTGGGSTPIAGSESTAITITGVVTVDSSSTRTDTCAITITESSSVSATTVASDAAAITISDASSSTSTLSTTDTAAITISDSSASALSSTRTDTAAITIVETDTTTVGLSASESEAITISDASQSQSTISTTDTAAVTITDTSSVGIVTAISASDTCAITITDSSAVVVAISTSDSCAITIADASQSQSTLSRSESVAVTIAETSAVSGTVNAVDSCAVTITESSNAAPALPGSETIAVSISEVSAPLVMVNTGDTCAITISETDTTTVGWNRTDSCAITISDASTSTSTLSGAESIAVTISDASAVTNAFSATDTAAVTIAETSAVFGTVAASESEAITIADASSVFVPVSTTDTCAITITDSSSTVISGSNNVSASDTCAITISDSSSIFKTNVITASESVAVTIAETSAVSGTVTTTESVAVTITDASSSTSTLNRTDTAAITIADSSAVGQFTNFPGSESVAIAIAETSSVQISGTFTVSASDTTAITIAESSAVAQTQVVVASDNCAITVNETSTVGGTVVASDSTAVSVDDQATIFYTASAQDTTAISISESSSLVTQAGVLQLNASETVAITITEFRNLQDPNVVVDIIHLESSTSTQSHFASESETGIMVGEEVSPVHTLGEDIATTGHVDSDTQKQSGID